jgi:hypothetical protein
MDSLVFCLEPSHFDCGRLPCFNSRQNSRQTSNSSYDTHPANHIEIVKWLWSDIRADGFHELLEGHQGGQATHTAAFERKQLEITARRGVYASGLLVQSTNTPNSPCNKAL